MPKPNVECLIANFRFLCASIAFIWWNAFMWKCSKSASGPVSASAQNILFSSFHWISKLAKWPAAGNSHSQTYSNTRRMQNRSFNLEDWKLRLQDSVQSRRQMRVKENGTRRQTCLRQSLRITYSLECSYNCSTLPFLLGPKSPATPHHQHQHHHHHNHHHRQHQHL